MSTELPVVTLRQTLGEHFYILGQVNSLQQLVRDFAQLVTTRGARINRLQKALVNTFEICKLLRVVLKQIAFNELLARWPFFRVDS
jgi:hypothetical protein